MSGRTIWKYRIPFPSGTVALPKLAVVLSCQMQGRDPMLWVFVDPGEQETVLRAFRVYGTGHPVPMEPGRYLATIQDLGLVWHVFEELTP